MMKVQVLGTGCAKCKALYANVSQAAKELGIAADIEKVEDIREIARAGVMTTPALRVEGHVKAAGKVLSVEDIKKLLAN